MRTRFSKQTARNINRKDRMRVEIWKTCKQLRVFERNQPSEGSQCSKISISIGFTKLEYLPNLVQFTKALPVLLKQKNYFAHDLD